MDLKFIIDYKIFKKLYDISLAMTKEQRIEAAQKRIAELRKLIDEWTKR